MANDSIPGTPAVGGRLIVRAMRDDVRNAILAMLVDGRLSPGTSVGIDQLARQLGVSPTPVREALIELEATGLVERVPHRGYQAAGPVSAKQAAELADARLVVETAAAEAAARRRDPDLIPLLRSVHHAHEAAARAIQGWDGVAVDSNGLPASIAPYFDADWLFHLTILDHCGNRFLRRMVTGLGAPLLRMRQTAGRGVPDAAQAVAEHARILQALEHGTPEQARAAMHEHLEAVRARSIADA